MRGTRLYGLGLAVALAVGLAAPAQAQDLEGRFTVSPSGGWFMFDDASALDSFGGVGLDVLYHLNETFGFGLYFDGARPTTKGEYFPAARHVYEDTTFIYRVGQQVTVANYGASARVRVPLGGLALAATAGVGRYTIWTDPEIMRRSDNFSGTQFLAGGGIEIPFGSSAGLRAEVRDYIFTNYERDRLNAVHPAHEDTVWPELREGIPEAEDIVHNLRISLGFVFIPGAR